MTKFKDEEVARLEAGGNAASNARFLAKWTQPGPPLPPLAKPDQRKDFIKAKYIDRRWFSDKTSKESKKKSKKKKVESSSEDSSDSSSSEEEVPVRCAALPAAAHASRAVVRVRSPPVSLPLTQPVEPIANLMSPSDLPKLRVYHNQQTPAMKPPKGSKAAKGSRKTGKSSSSSSAAASPAAPPVNLLDFDEPAPAAATNRLPHPPRNPSPLPPPHPLVTLAPSSRRRLPHPLVPLVPPRLPVIPLVSQHPLRVSPTPLAT